MEFYHTYLIYFLKSYLLYKSINKDIWSFGVLIWEILTLGAKPYPAMGNREVMQYVRSGGRLEKPGGLFLIHSDNISDPVSPVITPERLNYIMTSCWSQLPDNRPTFKRCVMEIENLKAGENIL